MKEYLMSLVSVSAVCAIASYLVPDREEKLKKGVGLALALAVLFTAVYPLPGAAEAASRLLDSSGGIFDTSVTDHSSEWLDGVTSDAVGEGIRRDVMREFGLKDGVSVVADVSYGSEITVKRVTVKLSGIAIFADGLAIERYIESNYCAECEVLAGGT